MQENDVDVVLKSSDLLSLYTEIDGETAAVSSTRSVILSKTTNNELVILDHIHFILLLSIPSTLQCERLLQFMVNSYAFAQQQQQQQQQYTTDADEQPSERVKHVFALIGMKTSFQMREPRLVVEKVERVSNQFQDELQYKFFFSNHRILYYFLNRFKKSGIQINGADYQVKILNFDAQATLFQGHSKHYIESQFMTFKNDQERVTWRFPHSQKIHDGLLHPSLCESTGRTTNFFDTFAEMEMAKIATSYKVNHRSMISYQSLYIDLSAMSKRGPIFRVNYMERKAILNRIDASPPMRKKVTKRKRQDTSAMKNQSVLTQYFAQPISSSPMEDDEERKKRRLLSS
jgi:hypothetical protein